MSWRLARSLVVLRAEIDGRWPNRDKRSDGSIGDAAHRDLKSDHNPNSAGVVQAIDVDEHTDTTERSQDVGRWLWDRLLESRDPRIKYVIYEGRMFSSYPTSHRGPAWTVGSGSGHTQHVHVSVVDDPSRYDDRSPWFEETHMADGHNPIDIKAHSLAAVPSWSPWPEYVKAGGTTMSESGVWPFSRADAAWYWKKWVVPLQEDVAKLQAEVKALHSALDEHKAGHATSGSGGSSDVIPDHVHSADGTTGNVKR